MEGASTVTTVAGALADVSLQGIVTEILGVIPVVLPAAITIMGVRKAISFALGLIQGL